MKKEELIKIIRISIVLAVLLGSCYFLINDNVLSLENGYRAIGISVTSISFFWIFYIKWGWKIPLINNIISKPNISGTWKGYLQSDWKDDKGEGIGAKDMYITIRQDFLKTHITTFTDNFIGVSYVESILVDKSKGVRKIIYLYKKETSDFGKQENNEGATELRIIKKEYTLWEIIKIKIKRDKKTPMKLEGTYWTNIKTNGSLEFERISSKHIESYEQGIEMFIKKIEIENN